jgi:hypothetical protein
MDAQFEEFLPLQIGVSPGGQAVRGVGALA